MPEYHLRFAVPGPSAGYTQRSRPYEIARCGTKPKMRSKRLA